MDKPPTESAEDLPALHDSFPHPELSCLRFTPAEAAKFSAFLAFCKAVAAHSGAAEREATTHPREYFVQRRIDFWDSVRAATNWIESIVDVLTEK